MRKRSSKKAKALARKLLERPEVVGFLFSKAATMRYTNAAKATREAYPEIGITEHYAREILRRNPPFCHPQLFVQVAAEDKANVARKFHGAVRPRLVEKDVCPITDTSILHEVLDARIEYQKALDKAIEAGMKEDSVIAWCDVVARGDLR